jgi:RHS repeat-associated protein
MRYLKNIMLFGLLVFYFMCKASFAALPTGWSNQDIGPVKLTGSASFANNQLTITGAGYDIYASSDSFHYVYQVLNGDGEIVAKVESVDNTDAWAKAGVMIRETLTDNAKHVTTAVTKSNGIIFLRRTMINSNSPYTVGSLLAAPYWIKLKRVGNNFSGFQSPDGITWTQVGTTITNSMNSSVYIGLAVTSRKSTLLCTSIFSNVSVNGVPVQIANTSSETPTLYIKKIDYNAVGQKTRIEYGNGVITTNTYDDLTLRLKRIYTVNSTGTILQDLSYTYDSVGNILSIADAINSASQSFKYDELNRLVQANGSRYGAKTYQYDPIGNIVSKDNKLYSYAEGGAGVHAVTSLSDGTTFTYDANGNMASKQKGAELTLYSYDTENHLTQIKKNGTVIATYEYDGDGGRTKKIANGITTKYVGALYEITQLQTTKHIFVGDMKIASVTAGKPMYYHGDHLGGANVVTDSVGIKKELTEYDPFGSFSRRDRYGSSEEIARFYFTGQKFDEESGLYYYGARYYNPELGRFISADLLISRPGDPQSFNRYAYSGNNPVNYTDPSGHGWFKKFFGQIFSVIVGVTAFVASGFNPVVGMQAYSITNSTISGAQAIANGASPFRILGSVAVGMAIGLGTADFLGGIANLGVRVGAFAAQGAVIGAAGAALTGGDIGLGAAFGAGTGATMGFLSSQQFTNYRNHGKFLSDEHFSQLNQRISDLAQMSGIAGDANQSFELISGQGELSSGISAGHTGMAVDGDAFGFYPKPGQGELGWLFGKSGPGEIRGENTNFIQHAQFSGGVFGSKVNGFQANVALMQKYNPGTFSLATNCSRFALDTARMIGINVPSNLTTFGQTNPAKVAAWSHSIKSWSANQ